MGNCACAIKDYYTNTTTSTPVYHHRRQRRLEAEATKTTEQKTMIKVVTTTGGIMELYSPITVEQITSEFPNHGIFLNPNPASNPPMLHNDNLCPGQLYYLLPLNLPSSVPTETDTSNYNISTPYRMSVDTTGTRVVYKNQPDTDVVPRNDNGSGVWKVRLVINPEHLSEILSQDNKTQQLIESVRTVAKCGSGNATNGGAKTSSSLSLSSSAGSSSTPNNSDQCSVSS